MAPASATTTAQMLLLSPAELSYLHDSLSLSPPVRPDGRTPTQFRPLIAETDILAGANGSARVCFADGTEAVVGVKAQVEKSQWRPVAGERGTELSVGPAAADADDDEDADDRRDLQTRSLGDSSWVETSIEVPGCRDDDPLPNLLSAMLTEALLCSGHLKDRLWINRRFHWKLYIDILLLSPPLSYPLPLLSITTHLALLSARLPRLKSELDEDPLFDDDWQASNYLYPYNEKGARRDVPSITLVVITVGSNFIFDPSKEELAAADGVLAVSVGRTPGHDSHGEALGILSVREIDTPARLTTAGVPNSLNSTFGDLTQLPAQELYAARETATGQTGVWNPPRGGVKRSVLGKITKAILQPGGVAQDVMDGLIAVQC